MVRFHLLLFIYSQFQSQLIKMDKPSFIANVRHIACVAFLIAAGQPYNEQINKDQFDSLLDGIEFLNANPDSTAEENHNNWMKMKKSQGWVYGKKKDFSKKTHPDLMPFDSLPIIEQRKDISDMIIHRLANELAEMLED